MRCAFKQSRPECSDALLPLGNIFGRSTLFGLWTSTGLEAKGHEVPPSTTSGTFANLPGETAVDFAVRAGSDLAQTVLAIQGPPGAGKTFTGAQMICALVAQGKRAGVTATGHSVIRNLLDAVAEAVAKLGQKYVTLGHKVDEAEVDGSSVVKIGDNQGALEALQSRPAAGCAEGLYLVAAYSGGNLSFEPSPV